MGVDCVTWIVHTLKEVAFAATGINPEVRFCLEGSAMEVFVNCVHGSAKVDWETVWFLDWKTKETKSPMSAVMFDGEYVKFPPAPTRMVWTVWADAPRAEAARTAMVAKRITTMMKGCVLVRWIDEFKDAMSLRARLEKDEDDKQEGGER